jgi:hypothetical protein
MTVPTDLPDGQISHLAVQPLREKYFASPPTQINSPLRRRTLLKTEHCRFGGVSARAHVANPRVSHAAVADRDTDPLLLDSERRYLEKSRRVHADHLEGCFASPIDLHRGTLLDLRGIRRQKIGDHLQVERIADLDQRRSSLDQGLALLDAKFMQASTIMSRRRVY